ncbi:hypothetical protein [Photobacterium sp. TLY01]|uniref:hypothetical protein n=1 Tax=Photobacterium sp. TLY01 TaxID=2907534 RepID=UPI001F38371F|nr:hypothetical protein [Photobacterium sp. TLY01]UIP27676.1 hypothetical protein LN341_13930 [Photobacterium sp. TLY01]
MSRQVIDTNVLIVASGEHPESPFRSENHPVEDPSEAEKVFEWLASFEAGADRMVIDTDWEIPKEYSNKLTEQDYGQRVFFEKLSKNQVDFVDIEWDANPAHTAKVAVLNEPLKTVIHDLADTKIVAACLKANEDEPECKIVNACDTDWYDWETELVAERVHVHQLIDDWNKQNWEKKRAK